jgi:hypothetical protein
VIETIKNVLLVIVVGAIVLFFYGKSVREKEDKQRAEDYVAERAWKDPLIRNCENAVRRIADSGTLRFGEVFGLRGERIENTDSGYLYYLSASDATTANTPVSMLCYTDRNGQVIRVVPQGK